MSDVAETLRYSRTQSSSTPSIFAAPDLGFQRISDNPYRAVAQTFHHGTTTRRGTWYHPIFSAP
jgi:hypothetical protein